MNRHFSRNIANIVFIIAVVGYFQLFKFSAIPATVRMLFEFAAGLLLLVFIIIRFFYPGNTVKMNFTVPILMLILGTIPSFFTVNAFHNQNFVVSLFASGGILYYFLYFFLHYYQVSTKLVLRVIVITGMFAVFLYYLQFSLFPRQVLDIRMLDDRGTIRLLVAGMLCSQFAYFYFLNQFYAKHNLLNLFLALLTMSIFILQGTRQLLFGIAFLTIVNLMVSTRVRSKFLITFLMSLAFIAVFLIFREIFIQINQVSKTQAGEFSEGIRIKAAKFFLTEFMPNGWTYLFGNGVPGPGSTYSYSIGLHSIRDGYNLSDIGIFGDYFKYGIIFIIGGIMMLWKVSFFKVSPEYQFMKYYVFMQCFTMIAGNGVLAGVDIVIIMILYVYDVHRSQMVNEQLQANNILYEQSTLLNNPIINSNKL